MSPKARRDIYNVAARKQEGQIVKISGRWYVRYWGVRAERGETKRVRLTQPLGPVQSGEETVPEHVRRDAARYMEKINAQRGETHASVVAHVHRQKRYEKRYGKKPETFSCPTPITKLEEYPIKRAGLWHTFELGPNPLEPWNLPCGPGCYAVIAAGVLIYVGQSQNVHKRIQQHKIRHHYGQIFTPWGTYPNVVIKVRKPVKYGDWAMIELRLIRRLNPPGNSMFCARQSPMWGSMPYAPSTTPQVLESSIQNGYSGRI